MAGTSHQFDEQTEWCDSCQRETTHRVVVQLKTESTKPENAEFSREPYRVSECVDCGERLSKRMNNA